MMALHMPNCAPIVLRMSLGVSFGHLSVCNMSIVSLCYQLGTMQDSS